MMPVMPVPLLALAAAASGALAILSAPWAFGQPWMNFVFKPLATLLVIAHAWPRGRAQPVPRRWVLLGLALSLCGDVALLWPERGFLPGLLSFLLAHLAYLRAFTCEGVRFAARRGLCWLNQARPRRTSFGTMPPNWGWSRGGCTWSQIR